MQPDTGETTGCSGTSLLTKNRKQVSQINMAMDDHNITYDMNALLMRDIVFKGNNQHNAIPDKISR